MGPAPLKGFPNRARMQRVFAGIIDLYLADVEIRGVGTPASEVVAYHGADVREVNGGSRSCTGIIWLRCGRLPVPGACWGGSTAINLLVSP